MNRRLTVAALLMVAAIGTAAFGQSASRPASGPRLTPVVLQQLLDDVSIKQSTDLAPSPVSGPNGHVTLASMRSVIAAKNIEVRSSGGQYSPPDDIRFDVVQVQCGLHDRPDRVFECTRLSVDDQQGRAIAPLSSESGRKSYRNALGQTWSVQEISNTYAAESLSGGFSVRYASPDGSSWTFSVTRADAQRRLLLVPSGQPIVPPRVPLRVQVRPFSAGWNVVNLTDRKWGPCYASAGGAEVTAGELAPRGASVINATAFTERFTLGQPIPGLKLRCGGAEAIIETAVGGGSAQPAPAILRTLQMKPVLQENPKRPNDTTIQFQNTTVDA